MSNPTMYDYDGDNYYYDEDTDTMRSYDGEEVYDAQDGTPISNDD